MECETGHVTWSVSWHTVKFGYNRKNAQKFIWDSLKLVGTDISIFNQLTSYNIITPEQESSARLRAEIDSNY